MTSKAAFSPDEWQLVLEGPPSAGLLVITASHGGTFRETFAMSKAYADARAQHGESELLDSIVSERPRLEHGSARSQAELRDQNIDTVRQAAVLVADKATTQERDDYRRFIIAVADKVAAAHREGGDQVSAEEAQAIQDITTALTPLDAGGS
jgi:hypothetical protein